MIALPLSVLALAAGVYLLVKVKREYLGGIFELLSWLVIVAALASLGYTGYKAFARCGNKCGVEKCHIEKKVIIEKEENCHKGNMGNAHTGCQMEGDSCVMDKATCEGIMGKEACDKMAQERGRCIVGKEECKAICAAKGKPCCAESLPTECTRKCTTAPKECCSKPKE